MPSSFKGLDLFGSGPHRFRVRALGQLVVPALRLNIFTSGSRYLGPLETEVVVTGRLVAGTESALWALREALAGQLLDPPAPGTLVDVHGRAWAGMSFVRLEEGDRTDRGRKVTLAYVATFLKFREYPQGEEG